MEENIFLIFFLHVKCKDVNLFKITAFSLIFIFFKGKKLLIYKRLLVCCYFTMKFSP